MPPQQESIKIFGGTASKHLAEQIAEPAGSAWVKWC